MSTARRNLEVKARCGDLARARQVVQELCGPPRVEHQVDTYFQVPRGRLKLREIDGQEAALIAYERSNEAATRLSHYHLVPVPDPDGLKTALAMTLGLRGQVRKRREISLHHHVRIHLDEVDGLGSFLELEAVLKEGEAADDSAARLDDLLARLAVGPRDFLAVSYADLLGLA